MLAHKAGVLGVENLEALASVARKLRAAFLELKAKADGGDAAAKQLFELRELELGHVTYEDYRKRNPDLMQLGESVREAVQMIAGEVVLRRVQQLLRAAGEDKEKLQAVLLEVGEALLAAQQEGAEPFDDEQRVTFYFYLGTAGHKHDRADMLDIAIEALADDAEDNEQLTEALATWKAKSADIKSKPAKVSK